MNKYKVEMTQTEVFVIDVKANTEQEAEEKAIKKFEELEAQGTEHYHNIEKGGLEIGTVYDVTDTEDPFNE